MDTSKLKPNDPRVKYETAQIRGKTYSYILGEPQGTKLETIVLIHGFPDIAFGWRYQIPYLMSLGFQVVVPNMLGYAGTDAPQNVDEFSLKSIAADVEALARTFVGEGQIILGGHDWGGAAVWRIAMWYPELIKGVFSVCTPVHGPKTQYTALEDLIAAGILTNFGYQLQLMGPEVEAKIQGEEQLRKFLNTMFGGRGPNGEVGFVVEKGVLFDNLDIIQPNQLLSTEELDHYTSQYMLQKAPQMRGPLNWYRTRVINHEEELPKAEAGPIHFDMPALFISATHDAALLPSMSAGMDELFKDLTRAEVDASHWALSQTPTEVNQHIANWINKVLNGAIKASL